MVRPRFALASLAVAMAAVVAVGSCDGGAEVALPTASGGYQAGGQGGVAGAGGSLGGGGSAGAGGEICGPPRAFPGAEGFGSDTPGGRGGSVIAVTSLAAKGAGTLHEALQATGPRIVVFRVGGTIELSEDIYITEPYLTVAGQTAPGDGIAIRGGGLRLGTHDVILRGLRLRVGDQPSGPHPDNRDCIGIESQSEPTHHIVIDHCSLSWSTDENMTVWYPAHDITMSWNIVSEGLMNSLHSKGEHSMGILLGQFATKVSIHHNLMAHNDERNPLVSVETSTEIVNNVVYNWGNAATKLSNCYSTQPSFANIIGNSYFPGVSTVYAREVQINDCWANGKVYVAGNVGPHRLDDTGDDWLVVNNYAGDAVRSNVPAVDPSGITAQAAMAAYELVLAHAGATAPTRDAVDHRVVDSVRSGSGAIIDSPADVGGWPSYQHGSAPPDGDGDGVPDAWESERGLDPADPADGSAIGPCGYSWVETYINGLIVLP